MKVVVDLTERLSANEEEAKKDMLADIDRIRQRIIDGKLHGFAYCEAHKDGVTSTGWSGYDCRKSLSFAISLLDTRYHNAILNDDGNDS